MRRSSRISRSFCAVFLGTLASSLVIGCGSTGPRMPDMKMAFNKMNPWADDEKLARSQSPDEMDSPLETTVETPMIGDHTTIAGLNLVTLQGVGLVTGLDGTGSDPPPSHYREMMLDDMRRRNIKNPNQILASPNTALVVVRAYLPPLVSKGDKFDIEVRVPGESESTSLNGGWLMETYLSEQEIVPGQGLMKGHVFAKAQGPILVSTGEGDKEDLAGVLRRGRVLGGGKSMTERDLTIFLRNDFRSFRNAKRIAERIGTRFFTYNEYNLREPLAEAKTDQRIVLKIPPKYKNNYPRYLQIIRNIAFRETDIAKRVRMEKLSEQLNIAKTSEKAALQLEAIGNDAIPTLLQALKNPSLEVRFHASVSLAYLEEPEGVRHLAQAAKEEPAFRIFAFAALASVDDAEAHLALRDLMSGTSAETRYGAFRSLSVLDANDPFILGEKLNEEFSMHVLDTTGSPLVHLTNRRFAEVVLFNADQEFETPITLEAGDHILITANAGSKKLVVSRYELGKPDQRKELPLTIAGVIRAVTDMGASYPDVAQMLVQADQQGNLPGALEIDALPKAGRAYFRPDPRNPDKPGRRARVGNSGLVPNLFDVEEPDRKLEPGVDGSWDRPPSQSEPGEKKEHPGDEEIAPEDDVLKDPRKWYDPRRLIEKPDFTMPKEKPDDQKEPDEIEDSE